MLAVAWEKQSESNAMWALSIAVPFTKPVGAGAGGYLPRTSAHTSAGSGAPNRYRCDRRGRTLPTARGICWRTCDEPGIAVEKVDGVAPMLPGSDPARRDPASSVRTAQRAVVMRMT